MNDLRIARAGDRGLFVELGHVSLDELHAAAAAVRRVPGSRSWIVGYSSLLGMFDAAGTAYESFSGAVREALGIASRSTAREVRTHSIPVSFADADAPDLPLLLERAGLTRGEFLAAIEGVSLRARFLGFLRGFAYLEGIPASWQMPRRPTSRARVPAGSFAIAGAMAGFYPADSPGGWNLIGRTAMPLWDVGADRPNVISAGDEIRIRVADPIDAGASDGERDHAPDSARTATGIVAVVRAPGQLTLVVPAANERRSEWGLPPGGPFDVEAAAAANLAVGNREAEAVLECAGVGPTLEIHEHSVLSWFGAEVAIRVGGRPAAEPRLFEATPGDVIEVGPLSGGLRGVLARRGGVADSAGRFSVTPHALRTGEEIGRGGGAATERGRLRALPRGDRLLVRALAGPHPASDGVVEWIATSRWTVSPAIDRTGVRLHVDGRHPPLPADLPSCGMQFGTVQCHPNGELVVMGPDHPITGGYLQPITVVSGDLWKLAQLRPGDLVRWQLPGVDG